jgi:hypothetical protein
VRSLTVPPALNLLVFRDSRQRISGPALKSAFLRHLQFWRERSRPQDVLGALLRAGELECAICDSRPSLDSAVSAARVGVTSAQLYMSITDRLAEALLAPDSAVDALGLNAALSQAVVPDLLELSPPEGFAYYALHPLAFAEVLAKLHGLPARLAVIGIRTIGVTLSAVTCAAARACGLAAERISVRPHGHPYNRIMKFSPQQGDFIRQQASLEAGFLVVDEGPGLSGSTFISVAEALVDAGVPRERIVLICGHEPDFDSLRADEASRRAKAFRWVAVSSEPRRPARAEVFIGGGQWRRHLFIDETQWPPSWTSMERLKYSSVSPSGVRRFFKFLGFGHYGRRVFTRESLVADAGFGPVPRRESSGFASYPWTDGRPMVRKDLSADVLARLAAYCTFRATAFAADQPDLSALEQMAEHNARESGMEASPLLRLERPVLADGRMQPHEWVRTPEGRMLKTDSGSHGDDHFFPGITDIAWDLAGAIVEWNMSQDHVHRFLSAYRRLSGDDAARRIADFITAYALFRWAYCLMAAGALEGSDEAPRLERAAAQYRAALLRARTLSGSLGTEHPLRPKLSDSRAA